MPRIYGEWIQDPTIELGFNGAAFPTQINNVRHEVLIDPPSVINSDSLDAVTVSAAGFGTSSASIGANWLVSAIDGTAHGPFLPDEPTDYHARNGWSGMAVYLSTSSREWDGPLEDVPPDWDAYEVEDDATHCLLDSVIWDKLVAREYHESIVSAEWMFTVSVHALPAGPMPGIGGEPALDVAYWGGSPAIQTQEFVYGAISSTGYEVVDLPAGAVDLTPYATDDNGQFVLIGRTVLDGTPVWEETGGGARPYGTSFSAEFGGNFSAAGHFVTYTLRPPRYRFYRDVDVTAADSAPRRKYPRDDGRGVGPARHYPPPTSRQASIRRGGATYL